MHRRTAELHAVLDGERCADTFKAEIAAEIIAYTENSIGMHVNDAKFYPEMTPTVFAWTAVIIAMSVLLEIVIRKLLRRFKNEP